MDISIFQATVLGVIQGLTEFLPISSSAHLLLPKIIFGWKDQGLIFDVALHLGSLLAVIAYFRKDIIELSQAVCSRCFLVSSTSYLLCCFMIRGSFSSFTLNSKIV